MNIVHSRNNRKSKWSLARRSWSTIDILIFIISTNSMQEGWIHKGCTNNIIVLPLQEVYNKFSHSGCCCCCCYLILFGWQEHITLYYDSEPGWDSPVMYTTCENFSGSAQQITEQKSCYCCYFIYYYCLDGRNRTPVYYY